MSSETVSDERLVDLIRVHRNKGHSGTYPGSGGMHPDWSDMTADALTELQSLRSKPLAGVEVKPMEWQHVTDQIPKHAYAAYTPFGRCLIVVEFLSMNHAVYRFNGADYETLDDAKAAAEADYRNRILSALLPKATAPVVSEPERKVMELKMTPIAEGLPVRDEMRGEQTILTYNDQVGAWDIIFMEVGWDDFDAGFALGVTHWLDISEMWPGVMAQVSSFYASPQPEVVITEEMVERACSSLFPNWVDRASWTQARMKADCRAALEAALKEA